MRSSLIPLVAALMAATGCTAPQALRPPAEPGPVRTVAVPAIAETVPVGTANDDAADDPAIWRNARQPAASLIVATDKKAGLHVYGLDGASRHFVPAGRVNNVDLADLGRRGIIVVASDRNDENAAVLLIYRLDPATARLTEIGRAPGGAGEAYGMCLARSGSRLSAFSVLKNGRIEQVRIDFSGDAATGRIVRSLRVETQPEGCVVDPRANTLFVGEEARGIWRFDARENGPAEAVLVAPVDGRHLVADVEGLAILPQGRAGGVLIASSQGDNAYAVFTLPGMKPAGRFRIAGGRIGGAEETDGIAIAGGGFGAAYPGGLFVAQDGKNEPNAQNFKLVSWAEVKKALGLR